jgi:hypothetical protein
MNIVLAVILVAFAIVLWTNIVPISNAMRTAFYKQAHEVYGDEADLVGWSEHNKDMQKILFRILIAFFGFVVLVLAAHVVFGTFYIGSAANGLN